jgi:hypothetical protein
MKTDRAAKLEERVRENKRRNLAGGEPMRNHRPNDPLGPWAESHTVPCSECGTVPPVEKQEKCARCDAPLVRDDVLLVVFVTVLTREQIARNDAAVDAGDNIDVPDAVAFCGYEHVIAWAEERSLKVRT